MTSKNKIFFWFGIELLLVVSAMLVFAWPLVAGTYDIASVTKAAAVSAVLVLLSLIPAVLWRRAAREFHRSKQATWASLGVPEGMVREREEASGKLTFQDPPADLVEKTIATCVDELDKKKKDS